MSTYNQPYLPKRTHTVLSLCLAILGLGGLGCFPSSNNNTAKKNKKEETETVAEAGPPRRGAEVMIGKKPQDRRFDDAETAYWHAQYQKNRTVPPREFTMAPKPPRNNDFGEFDEGLFDRLDTQPQLPGLPGGQDLMAMMGGSEPAPIGVGDFSRRRQNNSDFHSYPPQNNGYNGGYAGNNAPAAPARTSMSAAKAQTLGVADSGLMTDTRFYPIEQLVFGGEFPDLDKPENYRLMPRDIISITVKDHPEFSGKLEIQPDGTVRVPNLPDLVRLRGMAVDEASEELRQALQIYIKGECVVRVQANRARGGYYFVFGDVLQPGRFPMGLEPIKLSDAVLAANWETNLSRVDADGDELGPAFPTATPRGKFIAPRTADLANVMLVTPHRSQPVRTSHDVRQAMLGMMREDPIVRPGQIIVVPSLDPRRNASLGLEPNTPENASYGSGTGGFASANSSARLPQLGSGQDDYGYGTRGTGANTGYSDVMSGNQGRGYGQPSSGRAQDMMDCLTPVQQNMAHAFSVQSNTEVQEMYDDAFACDGYYDAGIPTDACYPSVGYAAPYAEGVELPAAMPVQAGMPQEYSAMAPSGQYSPQEQPRTEVTGLGVEGSDISTKEATPLRGRKLAKPKKKTSRKQANTENPKGDLKDWNLGF